MIILKIIQGVLAFPGALLQLVKALRATPQDNHEKIQKKITDEATAFDESGRPPT